MGKRVVLMDFTVEKKGIPTRIGKKKNETTHELKSQLVYIQNNPVRKM